MKGDQASHAPTGRMSQYKVIPTAGNSPLNIGTMAQDTLFEARSAKWRSSGRQREQLFLGLVDWLRRE